MIIWNKYKKYYLKNLKFHDYKVFNLNIKSSFDDARSFEVKVYPDSTSIYYPFKEYIFKEPPVIVSISMVISQDTQVEFNLDDIFVKEISKRRGVIKDIDVKNSTTKVYIRKDRKSFVVNIRRPGIYYFVINSNLGDTAVIYLKAKSEKNIYLNKNQG